MEDKIATSKIIIDSSHELTDLVREIHRSKAERIVLTFTEQTDILISPINLKVLQEAAEREGKLLIAQIIQNPTGIRNAKLANIKSIDTPTNPTEYEWEEAFEMIQVRKREKLEKKKTLERVIIKEDEKEIFEEKVEDNIEKERITPGYIDKRGTKPQKSFISIDQDIPLKEVENESLAEASISNSNLRKSLIPKIGKPRINIGDKLKFINKKKLGKILIFIFVPLILLSILGFLLYNQFGTLVKVKIFVASKTVEVENILTGDKNIEEIDFENLKVPIKTEEESKSLSDSITATGKAYKGEKATGKINIVYDVECNESTPKITLPAGHTVTTTSDNYSYSLVSGAELGCDTTLMLTSIPVVAKEFGDVYNFTTIGKSFSVQGYSTETLFAKSSTVFSGGTKVEYTVLSQLDVDNAVEQLSTTAIEEVKSALRESGGGWEIIEDTILSEVDKSSIKTDKKVGAEATTVNLDLTIKGTATYYKTTGLAEKLGDLLREKAEEENLFESEKDLELVLGDKIEKKVTIESVAKDIVKIKIVAKATIKPKIDKEQLVADLRGKSWDEGKDYINSLKYSEKKAEVVFNPINYPAFLKRFPDRRGGILITISELEIED